MEEFVDRVLKLGLAIGYIESNIIIDYARGSEYVMRCGCLYKKENSKLQYVFQALEKDEV